ncbi:ParA family protein [Azotobacter vinelandii]|uniref:ParA family protein n=1 Tax=Azotobacter vinelandii TaxID=354 RepID=UPI002667030F|nr:P-loop NTPase [Azotobacter vinelandii]WKN23687.1 AAA family ATPase [Azotobacter vinelandii]
MSTFDRILPELAAIFHAHAAAVRRLAPLLVNRDLNGRVRLIVAERWRADREALQTLDALAREMRDRLGPHAFEPERAVLFEENLDAVRQGAPVLPLGGFDGVSVVDRLATDGSWSSIVPVGQGVPRIVFFSIKGGVGRSTALAATAWALARQGRRVLVLDLDLESPGLSSSLLPDERRPTFGIADWLVEDLVDNGDAVFADLFATSPLSHDGEIYVVPAHGADPGDYVAKLGRVWMPKVSGARRETWSQRLQRLLDALEARWRPDVVLIDSRAGIDEVASACVTGLGAQRVMLFALDGEQTWTGYRILFRHWRTSGVARDIRERLQLVGAMVPELAGAEYVAGVRERAWDMFAEELYDEVPAGEPVTGDTWSFDESDEGAPHYPWTIRWHRGFAALQSLHARFVAVDPQEVESLFGPVIDGLANFVDGTGELHGER